MSGFDFDIDGQMYDLEMEWRQAYEAGIVAQADYESLARGRAAHGRLLEQARKRLERAEALKARVMVKIERLEDRMLGAG
jgi:hypothetical protein